MNKKMLRSTFAVILSLCMLLCTVLAACGGNDDNSKKEPPEATVSSISCDTTNVKLSFEYGEEFTYEGLKVIAQMSDGTEKVVPLTECTISAPDMKVAGARRVNVRYQGNTASYNITVAERVMPEIDSTPLFAVENVPEEGAIYRVEAEKINYASSKATATVKEDAAASEGKYLADYGVAGNYFGFKFKTDKEYTDVIIVLHLSSPSESPTSFGELLKVYLNYQESGETGEIDVSNVAILPGLEMPEPNVDEEKEAELPETIAEKAEGALVWEDRLIRGITLPEGTNEITFDVQESGAVCNIDYFEFYLGGAIYAENRVTITEKTTYVKEFEDFNLEKIVVREDIKNAHGLKDGEAFVETPDTNLANTSGGKAVGAFMPPTEISTVLVANAKCTVEIIFTAASVVTNKIKDNFEFYLDGVRMQNVEDKDIKAGDSARGEFWEWRDTSLGYVNLTPGNHTFIVKMSSGGEYNADCFKFVVHSYGEFYTPVTVSEIAVKRQPDKINYVLGESFDPTGLELQVTYSDGTEETITEGFSWTPNGPLTADDATVTIKYRGAETRLTINIANFTAVLSKNGVYTVEAETLDLSNFILRPDFAAAGRSFYEPADGANGGQAICGFLSHSTLTIDVKLDAAAKVKITARMSAENANGYALADNDKFEFAGSVIDVKANLVNDSGTFWKWEEVDLGDYELEAGTYTLTYEHLQDVWVKIDSFSFEVTDYQGESVPEPADVTINADGKFTANAEKLDRSDWILRGDQTSFTETDERGGECAKGHDVGTVITVVIDLTEKATVKVTADLASWTETTLTGWKVTFADKPVNLSGARIEGGESTGNWHMWQTVDFGAYELEAGRYKLTIEIGEGGTGTNIDCFDFTVSNFGA